MKNKQDIQALLLDTSFLLPTLGIDVGKLVSEALEKLDQSHNALFFSGYSLLEASWIVSRLSEKGEINKKSFEIGIKSIIDGARYHKTQEHPEIFIRAFELRLKGHKDMIDNILYSTSIDLNLGFLTLDKELETFIRSHKMHNNLVFVNQL